MKRIDDYMSEKLAKVTRYIDFGYIAIFLGNLIAIVLLVFFGWLIWWACRLNAYPIRLSYTILIEIGAYLCLFGLLKARENVAYPVRIIK